jgi:16S rRNA (uracil1498-N3)-methyltransferase
MPRIYSDLPLGSSRAFELPPGAARHVQVLRLQPGAAITLFDGQGGEWDATVERMGRSSVAVTLGEHRAIEREAARAVHLAVGMPANDRMDWLVEKATELGVASIQPLVTQRSVLRLEGERAAKKIAHWQAVAVAACEQCGRNRVPPIRPMAQLGAWLAAREVVGEGLLLSLAPGALPVQEMRAHGAAATFLSGPEGGLAPGEEEAAIAVGFAAVSLGARVLRAETAALAALAILG